MSTRGAVTITSDDTSRLNEGEFLNDSLIDFYVKWVLSQVPLDQLQRVHVYNSFFHNKIKKLWCVCLGPSPCLHAQLTGAWGHAQFGSRGPSADAGASVCGSGALEPGGRV
jgi:hypothetical protein